MPLGRQPLHLDAVDRVALDEPLLDCRLERGPQHPRDHHQPVLGDARAELLVEEPLEALGRELVEAAIAAMIAATMDTSRLSPSYSVITTPVYGRHTPQGRNPDAIAASRDENRLVQFLQLKYRQLGLWKTWLLVFPWYGASTAPRWTPRTPRGQSHGGIGSGCDQRPRRAARAWRSAAARTSLSLYFL